MRNHKSRSERDCDNTESGTAFTTHTKTPPSFLLRHYTQKKENGEYFKYYMFLSTIITSRVPFLTETVVS